MSVAQVIQAQLQAVQQERAARQADPELGRRARWVREFQAQRLRQTHADLLEAAATRPAARFFLDQLYGTQDFVERDAQFARIVPAIVRLFSGDVSATVARLAELHALSERFDSAMGRALAGAGPWDERDYATAWRSVGNSPDRERQVDLVAEIAAALQRYTRHPSLGRALRLMRLPARAAGLLALQHFLEEGFDTFARLPDADAFVATVVHRERAEVHRLFDPTRAPGI